MTDELQLLMVAADSRAPVLEGGLSAEAAERGPRPKKVGGRHASHQWGAKDGDSNDLSRQRWAVIAPEGGEGDAMLDAIRPLVELRREEQGEEIKVYRVPPGMDTRASLRFQDDVYRAEDVPEHDRPVYLLLLGDLCGVSLHLQQVLAGNALVGRLHIEAPGGGPDLTGYAAYAEKVVRHARGAAATEPDLLFHVASDGTRATLNAEVKLVMPGLEAAQDNLARGKLRAASVRKLDAASVDGLLAAGASERPSVLLSVSHGLGAPQRGWGSVERQRREQGALVLAENEILDAERMRGQAFLPGGLWFSLACFGAGTPKKSAYRDWLELLSDEPAYRAKAAGVLASLPPGDEPPFLAAMPQAALASPRGPLAVIGHIDLAWTYAFSGSLDPKKSKKSRILSTLEVMARGSRVGAALDALMDFYRQTNDALVHTYEDEEAARREGRSIDGLRKERGHLWMARHDLRGYVLLGDPAARLSLTEHAEGPRARPAPRPAEEASPAPAAEVRAPLQASPGPHAGAIPVAVKEAAVHALLRGTEAPLAIAARSGATLDEVWAWFDAYRQAGRGAL